MRDVVIVGSGASGVAAALELSRRGIVPLIVDVGYTSDSSASIDENFYDYRRANDTFQLMIGSDYGGLAILLGEASVPVKLTAPASAWVTRDADRLAPIEGHGFSAVQSLARGGLANAWGAGLYRFVDADMRDFPITAADLDPYFDVLTAHIGIAGADDDLAPDLGPTTGLSDPLPLSRNIGAFYSRYNSARRPASIRIGRARIAVERTGRGDRPAYRHRSLEFYQEDRSLYSPRYTIDALERQGKVEVADRMLVKTFEETDRGVAVRAHSLDTGATETFDAKTVLLAAGAINTTRIVLASVRDYETRLPLLENPALQVPLVLPTALGHRLDRDAFGLVQLNLVWDSRAFGARLQGSLMEVTAPSRAEFFGSFPLSARANLGLIRNVLPAMLVMQLYWPGDAQPAAAVSLRDTGVLRIDGSPNRLDASKLGELLPFLRRLGAWTLPRLVVTVPTGHAVHYAATLPMKLEPGRYECYPSGRLHGTRRVFIADSASFTSLPAKNMSFAMMANAMRIAAAAVEESTR